MPTPPSPHWARIKALFEAAAELGAGEREALFSTAGLDDEALAELRSLLAHHDEASGGTEFLSQPAVPAEPARTGQRLGAWQVVRAVGAGGMGEVFEARRADGSYEGRAAVKLLKRGMDSAAVLQRFAQERQALARLSHPHIARLLDAGASEDGLPYFVLEYVDGQPIDVAARGLPLEARLKLFLQLADAVAYAHRNLLVHRDLKPGNVLVDGEGQVKLLDFGIAKALDPLEAADGNTTVGGVRPYTPHYASPEQVRGEPVSTATDIYSLGVLLYQMLTGTRPTGRSATTPAEAARSVLEDEPTRPSSLSPEQATDPLWLSTRKRLQGDLDNILLKALEKTTARRYASVETLAADVQHFLAGRPVSARPASAAYVAGKFVRRNRWAVLAGALGGLGLASGLAAALLQERHAAVLGVLGLAGGLVLALLQGRQAAVARDLAQTRLAETRAIVSDVMGRHADAVHFLPGGAALKAELLQNMLGHLDRLARQAGDDAAFAGELALAYGRLAHLEGDHFLLAMEQSGEADAHASRALPLFEQGEPAHAGDPNYAIWWARAWRARSEAAQERGDLATALQAMDRMIATVQRGLERHPHHALLRSELGSAHFGRSRVFSHWGRPHLNQPDTALAELARAEALYEDLLQGAGGSDEDRHQLGTIAGARLLACCNQGRDEEAVAHGLRAVASRRANLALQPEHVAYRNGLVTEANNLGVTLLDVDQPERALEFLNLAMDTLAGLERDDPAFAGWREARVRNGLHLARALLRCGRPAQALPLLQAGLNAEWLRQAPGGARRLAIARLDLAQVRLALAEPAAALAEAETTRAEFEAWLREHADDTDAWLLLARTQRLLHDLQPAEQRPGWREAHMLSVARARANGPLLPRQERAASW